MNNINYMDPFDFFQSIIMFYVNNCSALGNQKKSNVMS
jgi:hypothetical protein